MREFLYVLTAVATLILWGCALTCGIVALTLQSEASLREFIWLGAMVMCGVAGNGCSDLLDTMEIEDADGAR